MTEKSIERLIKFRKEKADSITEDVFNAVRMLEIKLKIKPTPNDIKKYLDDKTRQEVEWKYHGTLNRDELEEMIEKKNIVIRTIMRKLRYLVNQEHRLDHVDNTYSIKDTLKSDIRIYAQDFGLFALSDMMRRHYCPSLNTVEQNTEELIKALGVYLVYCFAQAARPVNDTAGIDKYGEKSLTSDKLASSWILNVLSPLDMYNYFFAVIDSNQQRRQNRMRSKRSLYELETETVEKILDAIKKKYPEYYESLFETSSSYIEGPKESAVKHMRRKEIGGKSQLR